MNEPSTIHPQFNKFLCYDAWFLTFPTAMLMLANFFPLTLLWPLLNPAYRYILSSPVARSRLFNSLSKSV